MNNTIKKQSNEHESGTVGAVNKNTQSSEIPELSKIPSGPEFWTGIGLDTSEAADKRRRLSECIAIEDLSLDSPWLLNAVFMLCETFADAAKERGAVAVEDLSDWFKAELFRFTNDYDKAVVSYAASLRSGSGRDIVAEEISECVRRIKNEMESLPLTLLNDEESSAFTRRWKNVKESIADLETLLSGDAK